MADEHLVGLLGDTADPAYYRSGILNALMHPPQARMDAYSPSMMNEKIASGFNRLFGGDTRQSMADAHRWASLISTALAPFGVAHDTARLASEGVRDGRPDKAAAAAVIGAGLAALPSAVRGMTRLPSFEAVRDVTTAARLAHEGSTPAAFSPIVTGDSVMRAGRMFGDMRNGMDMVVRHPGFEPSVMNKVGGANQINGNNPLPPEVLRLMYKDF